MFKCVYSLSLSPSFTVFPVTFTFTPIHSNFYFVYVLDKTIILEAKNKKKTEHNNTHHTQILDEEEEKNQKKKKNFKQKKLNSKCVIIRINQRMKSRNKNKKRKHKIMCQFEFKKMRK